jgi:hypothetical protein
LIKKIAFIALIVAAVVCGTWGYFYLQDLKKPTLKPLDILPDSCGLLIEIKDPAGFAQQLTQGNVMWEEILKIKDVQRFNETLLGLDSLCNGDDTREFLGKEPFYIALYGNGDVVYAFDLSDVNEAARTLEFLEKTFSAKKLSTDLYECTLKNEKPSVFYIYTHSGLVLASVNKSLLENIGAGRAEASLSTNKAFNDSYKTAAKDKGIDVFVHFPFFRENLWNNFFAAERNTIGAEEKWIPIDVDIQPSDVNLHGFIPVDSLQLSLAVKSQEARTLQDLYEKLPYNTVTLEAISISDYGLFCRDLYHGDSLSRRVDLKKYSDSLAASAQTEIINFAGNYVARVKVVLGDSIQELGIFDLSDEEKARNVLRVVCDSTIMNSDTASLFISHDKKLFSLLSAGFFKASFSCVAVINEMAVFSKSMSALRQFRREVNEKVNFSKNERAMQFLEKDFSSDLNYLYYSDVFRNREGILSAFSERMQDRLTQAPDLFEKFAAIGFSLQNLKEGIFYKAQASFNPRNKMYQGTLWETLLDTSLYRTPEPMLNHKTGESELLCQDLNNSVYLLASTGKVLWKKNVGERILGDVKQIDYFANGKLQMLFATNGFIHLLDRNGNYVEGFPVKIKAGAAGGVSVFDYDGSRNYRIWLPLQNNTVICLNNNLKSVDGFVPVSIKAPLANPIQHVVLQQKDYFILTDTLGNIYSVNRKGEPRINFKNKVGGRSSAVYLDVGKDISKTKLWFVDKESKTIRTVTLDDKPESYPVNVEVISCYFFDTLQENGAIQVVLQNDEKFIVTDAAGKPSQTYGLSEKPGGDGSALLFGDQKVYAWLSTENGKLHLLNTRTQKEIDNEIVLSSVPGSYNLIRSQGNYLVGYYHNKIFCLRP